MFGGHSFNENPPYFAYPDFFICPFRISSQKYTFPSKNDMCLMIFDFFCSFFFLFSRGDLFKWPFLGHITKGWPPIAFRHYACKDIRLCMRMVERLLAKTATRHFAAIDS